MKTKSIIKILIALVFIQILSCKQPENNEQAQQKAMNGLEKIDTTILVTEESKYAKQELDRFLTIPTANLLKGKILVNDKETLVSIAEPILFNIYGKEEILDERPYEIYLFGDYWIMRGTLPKGSLGGTFSIAINKFTCEVIGITHGK